jgi:hypothetical protein
MTSNDQKLRRGLALAVIVGALAAPAASAAPIDPEGVKGEYTVKEPFVYEPQAASDGFDWGDAGIGAAAVLALGAIGAGAAIASGRIQRQPAAAQRAR